MKRLLTLILFLLLTVSQAWAQPNYPEHYSNYVNDFAKMLSQMDTNALLGALEELERSAGIEITLVTIASLADYDAQSMPLPDYAARLFDTWGVGDKEKNNGVMVLVSLNDREVWIEMGLGYAGQYDAQMQTVVDTRMLPYFRNGEYSRGLYEGVNAVIGVVTGAAPVQPAGGYNSDQPNAWVGVVILVVIVLLIVACIAAGVNFFRKGKKGWGAVFFSIAGVLIIFLIKMLLSGKGKGGGFGGGRSGGGGAGGRW